MVIKRRDEKRKGGGEIHEFIRKGSWMLSSFHSSSADTLCDRTKTYLSTFLVPVCCLTRNSALEASSSPGFSQNHFKSSTGEPVAPRFTETEVSAMLVAPSPAENQMALIPRGETPQIQEQNYSRGYDLFSQVFQKEHSPMHHLGISNEYNASGSQVLDPNST
ncbi:unnamed protein product [Sphenostylis stenocarpa]|uniref:Uncharacterized protein n=1 Tax=Sphenostylis stenocarpa TaxID=92480 RepID=A0AA86VKK9_9FABA|nr:unnamed protein product [Sphenostylis stenocarpa]